MIDKATDMLIIDRGSHLVVVQEADEYGAPGLDIRLWFHSDSELGMTPTKKGARVPEESHPEFLNYVLKTILGWSDDDLRAVGDALRANGWDEMHEKWSEFALMGAD